MATLNLKRRLSDFKYLFKPVEQKLKEAGKWIDKPTREQANEMFNYGFAPFQAVLKTTLSNRKRRHMQVKWTTVVNILRDEAKRRKVANDSGSAQV